MRNFTDAELAEIDSQFRAWSDACTSKLSRSDLNAARIVLFDRLPSELAESLVTEIDRAELAANAAARAAAGPCPVNDDNRLAMSRYWKAKTEREYQVTLARLQAEAEAKRAQRAAARREHRQLAATA